MYWEKMPLVSLSVFLPSPALSSLSPGVPRTHLLQWRDRLTAPALSWDPFAAVLAPLLTPWGLREVLALSGLLSSATLQDSGVVLLLGRRDPERRWCVERRL